MTRVDICKKVTHASPIASAEPSLNAQIPMQCARTRDVAVADCNGPHNLKGLAATSRPCFRAMHDSAVARKLPLMKMTAEAESQVPHSLRTRLPAAGDRGRHMPPRGPFFSEDEMNVYRSIGFAVGTAEALALAVRLSAWHDAMVAHQRPADTARAARCDDDCPHAEARFLWLEAVEVFGEHTKQFKFLRRHGCSNFLRTAA